MEDVLISLLEPLALVVYALLAALLAIAGIALELLGLTGRASSLGVPSLWLLFMGTVVLFFGYLITRDKLLPRVRDGV